MLYVQYCARSAYCGVHGRMNWPIGNLGSGSYETLDASLARRLSNGTQVRAMIVRICQDFDTLLHCGPAVGR